MIVERQLSRGWTYFVDRDVRERAGRKKSAEWTEGKSHQPDAQARALRLCHGQLVCPCSPPHSRADKPPVAQMPVFASPPAGGQAARGTMLALACASG